MSLDVYLTIEGAPVADGPKIYIREDGQNKEISRTEWDERFPGREPVIASGVLQDEVHTDNITHNLTIMASEAGVYMPCWRPEEIGIETAEQLIQPLRDGLKQLESDPERFKKFNPENEWGTYENLTDFLWRYLAACETYPAAKVSVWR